MQKYEKGTNRVSAGRLQQIADIGGHGSENAPLYDAYRGTAKAQDLSVTIARNYEDMMRISLNVPRSGRRRVPPPSGSGSGSGRAHDLGTIKRGTMTEFQP